MQSALSKTSVDYTQLTARMQDFARAGATAAQVAQMTGGTMRQAEAAVKEYAGSSAQAKIDVDGLKAAQAQLSLANVAVGETVAVATTHAAGMTGGMRQLDRSLGMVAATAIGANHQLGGISGLLLSMVGGGTIITGALAGVAALAFAYDKLTESARKTTEENNKLIASLQQAMNLKGAGAGGATVFQVQAAMDELPGLRTKRDQLMADLATLKKLHLDGSIVGGIKSDQLDQTNEQIRQYETLISFGKQEIETARAKAREKLDGSPIKDAVKDTLHLKDAAQQADQMFKNLVETTKKIVLSGAVLGKPTAILEKAADKDLPSMARILGIDAEGLKQQRPGLGADPASWEASPGGILTKKQLEELQKINDGGRQIKGAVEASAMAIGQIVVSALNIGGGGKGSSLGGAIGGALGTAAGYYFGGPVGAALGGLVGNVGGSLLGGLFDHHKKAVDHNTDAIKKLTDAMFNGPSGFKYAYARYGASQPVIINGNVTIAPNSAKDIGAQLRLNAMRGGVSPLLVAA